MSGPIAAALSLSICSFGRLPLLYSVLLFPFFSPAIKRAAAH